MDIVEIISKMIDTVLVGGLEIYYGGIPFDYIFKGVFFGYMHYYFAFCLLTAGTYCLIEKLKRNKQ